MTIAQKSNDTTETEIASKMTEKVEEEFSQEVSDEECEVDEEEIGDDQYQLTKDEGPIISAKEWKNIFAKAQFSEELLEKIMAIKPYERSSKTGRIVCTKSLNELVMGICLFFNKGSKIKPKIMKSLCKEIFSCCDLLYCLTLQITKMMSNGDFKSKFVWSNIFSFLKFTPNPAESVKPLLFNQKHHILRSRRKVKLINAWQAAWIQIMKCNVPNTVLCNMIPHITDNVLGGLKEPHKTSDFFFKIFEKGDVFSILALSAIFKLIVDHNFEYPNFYDQVYSLTKPFVLYMSHKQKFVELLNVFLSSTHIPSYVVSGFTKRLSRCLLYAPIDAQEPILGLIRNLITRHPTLSPLMHRELPATLDKDPYDVDEPSLSKCNATESSLWEIKTLQQHWLREISKRSCFITKPVQKMESFVRFRCQDEYFYNMMTCKFGKDTNSDDLKYSKSQDGSDDEEEENDVPDEPRVKRSKKDKKGKFAAKREVEQNQYVIPTNFTAPNSSFFPSNSVNYDYEKFWKL